MFFCLLENDLARTHTHAASSKTCIGLECLRNMDHFPFLFFFHNNNSLSFPWWQLIFLYISSTLQHKNWERKNKGSMGGIAWTEEEDYLLKKCIEQYGEGKWHRVPQLAGLFHFAFSTFHNCFIYIFVFIVFYINSLISMFDHNKDKMVIWSLQNFQV